MSSQTKCDVASIIPKNGTLTMPEIMPMVGALDNVVNKTNTKTAEYRAQTNALSSRTESFTVLREGIDGTSYVDKMREVRRDLDKIANAEYQRERLHAINEESNKLLISESYKFILWSILAILAVMALLKLKEMFGQDDAAEEGGGNGGLFAYILGLFGIGSMNTDDIANKTGDVKEALSSAGVQLKEAGEKFTTGITEGADNLVSSVNEAAAGAVEGAKGLADKVGETATDAVNRVGDAVGNVGAPAAGAGAGAPVAATPGATGAGTGGRGSGRGRSGGKK
jgi:hypothetical protein